MNRYFVHIRVTTLQLLPDSSPEPCFIPWKVATSSFLGLWQPSLFYFWLGVMCCEAPTPYPRSAAYSDKMEAHSTSPFFVHTAYLVHVLAYAKTSLLSLCLPAHLSMDTWVVATFDLQGSQTVIHDFALHPSEYCQK